MYMHVSHSEYVYKYKKVQVGNDQEKTQSERMLFINITNLVHILKWPFSHSVNSHVQQKVLEIPRDSKLTKTRYKYQNFGFRQVDIFFDAFFKDDEKATNIMIFNHFFRVS